MKNTDARRPFGVYVLMVLLVLLGISAIGGAVGLLADPSGKVIGIPLNWLEHSPFDSYLIPGIILLVVLGIYPIVVAFLLYCKPQWSAVQALERGAHQHWSWLAALTAGLATVIWVVVQFLMLGARHPLQIGLEIVIITLGMAIIALSLFPSVRRYYALL
jgi:hypothetical protein